MLEERALKVPRFCRKLLVIVTVTLEAVTVLVNPPAVEVLIVMEERVTLAVAMTQGLFPAASKIAVTPATGGAVVLVFLHGAPPLVVAQLQEFAQSVEVEPSQKSVVAEQTVVQAACAADM